MGLRPGRCYSSTKDRPYTRHAVKVHKRNYIGAVPGMRTRQWNMGMGAKEFNTISDLSVECGKHGMQIRDNAIESARLIVNRALIKKVGKEGFFLKLRVYPHNILRENKQAQGAHADRIQKGMSHAFGKVIGRAARVRDGQIIFSVLIDDADKKKAEECLKMASSRFPCKVTVNTHKDVESIGTKPKKTRDIIKEEAAKEEEGKTEEKEGEKKEEKPGAKKEEKSSEKKDAKSEKKDAKK